jgi:chemotaxis regulatin CheY-phosphate phosphatase CheZ
MDSTEFLDPPFQMREEPEGLLKEFRERSEALDTRLDKLQDLIQQIRGEIHDESDHSLTRLARVAQDMADGKVYQEIDIQAKGEIGALVKSLNQTLQNLQQLDASVKHQSTQVPELAAQLDAITADTEQATQVVMNRLDTLMNAGEEANRSLTTTAKALQLMQDNQLRFQTQIDDYLSRASGGENPTQIAQEVLDFLFEHQMTSRMPPVDLSVAQDHVRQISDEAFEILNTLQFQDITRQKVEKVISLLKQFKDGLNRLLTIFKIHVEESVGEREVFEHRQIATQDNIFETSLHADDKKQSVEDIIAQFKKGKG